MLDINEPSTHLLRRRAGGIMKWMLVLGGVLLIAGVFALAYQGITYTQHEKVAQLGSVQITTKAKKRIPLPPALGSTAVGVGAILIVVSVRRG
jgi:hypothetical protein